MPIQRAVRRILVVVGLLATGLAMPQSGAAAEPSVNVNKTLRGTLVGKSGKSIQVRPDEETQARIFILAPAGTVLDPKVAKFVRELEIGSEVEVTATPDGHRISSLLFLNAPGTFGLLNGVVTEKTATSIDIKDDSGKTERYIPPWTDAGFVKEMLQAIAQRNVGDRVQIRVAVDDHRRVSTMRLLARSPNAPPPASDEGGTIVGQFVEKGKDWITIQTDAGEKERFVPQRVIGAGEDLDKDVLKAIAIAKRGDRLEASWFKDGERRLYSLKAVAARSAKP